MTGLISTLSVALSATVVNQRAIEVISHNVANVNTKGYRRQELVLKAGVPTSPHELHFGGGTGQLGTGVMIDSIKRFTTSFLDRRYRAEVAESSKWVEKGNVLSQAESILSELTNSGLLKKMDNFWDSWQRLSADPTSDSFKAAVREEGRSLAAAFNSRLLNLDDIYDNQDISIRDRISEVNEIAVKVARLNEEICHAIGIGDQPNDLLDERDLLLDRLAEVAGASSFTMDSGAVNVSIGGHILVYGSGYEQLQYNSIAKDFQWADGERYQGETGELTGLLEARAIIDDQRIRLNDLAEGMIDWINDVHQSIHQFSNAQADETSALGFNAGDFWVGGTGVASILAPVDPNVPPVVTGAATSAIGANFREAGTGTYLLETRDNGGVIQFRLKDPDNQVLEIDDGGGNISTEWIDVPTVGPFTYDTGRGFTITFNNPATFGADSVPIEYTSRGINLALPNPPNAEGVPDPIVATDSLSNIAAKINGTRYLQPEGRVVEAFVEGNRLYLTGQDGGASHAVIVNSTLNDSGPGSLTFSISATPPPFFDGANARTIRLSDEVIASLDNIIATKAEAAPGDGNIALQIAEGRSAINFWIGGADGYMANANETYNLQVTEFALEIKFSTTNMTDRDAISGAIEQQRLSYCGVSLDEEAISLIKFQKAFQASARIVSVVNDMLETLIALGS